MPSKPAMLITSNCPQPFYAKAGGELYKFATGEQVVPGDHYDALVRQAGFARRVERGQIIARDAPADSSPPKAESTTAEAKPSGGRRKAG